LGVFNFYTGQDRAGGIGPAVANRIQGHEFSGKFFAERAFPFYNQQHDR
jgi:hypothetical protein